MRKTSGAKIMDDYGNYDWQHRKFLTWVIGTIAVGGIIGGLVAVGIGLYLIWPFFAPPSERTIAELKNEGNEIIRRIEAYKDQHHKYPLDLASAGIDPPTHDHGNWNYYASAKESGYQLWICYRGTVFYDSNSGWMVMKPD
jgi:hypothetical protein